MSRRVTINVGALILMTVSHASGCGYLTGCREPARAESVSPDGKLAATVYALSCGVDGRYMIHVNVHDASERQRPDEHGLIQSGMVFAVDDDHEVKVAWKDGRSLLVTCPSCEEGEVLLKKTELAGVSILY